MMLAMKMIIVFISEVLGIPLTYVATKGKENKYIGSAYKANIFQI